MFNPGGLPQAAVPHCSNCNKEITATEIQGGKYRQDTNGRLICAGCLVHFEFDAHLVDGYTIEKKLGAGAFGAVYKATQENTGRVIALKTIKPQLVSNEKDIQRFFREANTGAKLVHPNIAGIFDSGECRGTHFIAMEYIDGQELTKLIDQFRMLDVGYTLRVGIQIANALAHAFQQGIVHRDIKPDNILVTSQGQAKLVDFGLAKNFQEAGKSGLTAPGEGMGTLAYMPPEQLDNALMADQRSDIYSLGATLYHCLSGKRPFNEKTTRQFILKILKEMPTPLRDVNPTVPPEVQGIIERAMAKKPEQRYQKPAELENDLKQIFEKLAAQYAAQQRRPG
jgi:serine/threonine-protein kinase